MKCRKCGKELTSGDICYECTFLTWEPTAGTVVESTGGRGIMEIKVTEEVKLLLDKYIDDHNRLVDEFPNSVMAEVGKRTYSDIILWWHSETFNRPISEVEARELGL